MPKRKAETVTSIASEIEAMKLIGMTDEQIRETILKRNNPLITVPVGAVVSADAMKPGNFARVEAPLTAPQQQDKNALGPDPEIVARHQAFLANYQPPVLEETFRVTLDKRRADYVRRWAGWQSALRKGEVITPERAIDLMVRRLWQLDPDRQSMGYLHGATGGHAIPRAHHSTPAAGTPPSVPQG